MFEGGVYMGAMPDMSEQALPQTLLLGESGEMVWITSSPRSLPAEITIFVPSNSTSQLAAGQSSTIITLLSPHGRKRQLSTPLKCATQISLLTLNILGAPSITVPWAPREI